MPTGTRKRGPNWAQSWQKEGNMIRVEIKYRTVEKSNKLRVDSLKEKIKKTSIKEKIGNKSTKS